MNPYLIPHTESIPGSLQTQMGKEELYILEDTETYIDDLEAGKDFFPPTHTRIY